jgi:hypothetical protein
MQLINGFAIIIQSYIHCGLLKTFSLQMKINILCSVLYRLFCCLALEFLVDRKTIIARQTKY